MANNEKATVNWIYLPEDFWAFNFELTNTHLFQQKVIPAWRYSAFANSSWSCLLISASKVHWRLKPSDDQQSGKFSEIVRVSFWHAIYNVYSQVTRWNALRYVYTARVAQQCLDRKWNDLRSNNGHLTSNLNTLEMSCLESDAWSYFETLIQSQKQVRVKIWDNFPQVQLTKLPQVLEIAWQSK